MKSFDITFDDGFFRNFCPRKGDVMTTTFRGKVQIVSIYDQLWWVKMFRFFKIPIKPRNTIKLIPVA